MSIDSVLARLRAGLDEDERIARRAFMYDEDGADRWQLDGRNVWTEEARPTLIVQGIPGLSAAQIARQDPKATLGRVEAIRRVIDDYTSRATIDSGPQSKAFGDGYMAACRRFVETLASIYPDPTEEQP